MSGHLPIYHFDSSAENANPLFAVDWLRYLLPHPNASQEAKFLLQKGSVNAVRDKSGGHLMSRELIDFIQTERTLKLIESFRMSCFTFVFLSFDGFTTGFA